MDTYTKGESNNGLEIGGHENIQIGQRCFQILFAQPNIVLVFVSCSRFSVQKPKLDKDIIEPKVGGNKGGVRVVVSAKIDLTTLLDEVVYSEERYITTK